MNKRKTYYVVRIENTLWIDGVKKRTPPKWAEQLPHGDLWGYAQIQDDGSVIYEPELKG